MFWGDKAFSPFVVEVRGSFNSFKLEFLNRVMIELDNGGEWEIRGPLDKGQITKELRIQKRKEISH